MSSLIDPGDRVFVSLSEDVSGSITFSLQRALASLGVEPLIYQGVQKPIGGIVTNTYLEARSDVRSASLLIMVVGLLPDGRVSDDWTFAEIGRFKDASLPILLFQVPVQKTKHPPAGIVDFEIQLHVRSLRDEADVVGEVTAAVFQLLELRSH